MDAARARGRLAGRKKKLKQKQIDRMVELYDSKDVTISEICKVIGINRTTMYRYLKDEKERKQKKLEISDSEEIKSEILDEMKKVN